ncbi:MAG: DUF424 family protein [Candidatus Thermoplasmatota archaeon]|nr:DUF424 family protein [Candidatus Thermoplasmatota archaeon]
METDVTGGEKEMVVRVHRTQGETVLAACDRDLLGKKLMTGRREYLVSPGFYGSTPVAEEELVQLIRASTIVNLLGSRTVGVAKKAGLLEEGATTLLDGVEHAEIVRML